MSVPIFDSRVPISKCCNPISKPSILSLKVFNRQALNDGATKTIHLFGVRGLRARHHLLPVWGGLSGSRAFRMSAGAPAVLSIEHGCCGGRKSPVAIPRSGPYPVSCY